MATKIANGNGNAASGRFPLRHQGSSAAGQHPMTVALTPVPRVDYSVTKGGARTWAVLLVFMFLCSSLYTVFSAKEVAELAGDLDGDGDLDLDDSISDDIDEVAEQQRKLIRDTTPSTEEDRRKTDRRQRNDTPTREEQKTADDDEDDEDEGLEQHLFAGLRKKIESNLRKVQKMVQQRIDEDDDSEERSNRIAEERMQRRKRRHRKEKDDEKEPEKPKAAEKKPAKAVKKPEPVAKKAAEKKEEKREEKKEVKKTEQKPAPVKEEPKKQQKQDDDDDDDDEDDKKNDKKEDQKKEAEEKKDDDDDDDDKKEEQEEKKEEPKKEEEEKKEEKKVEKKSDKAEVGDADGDGIPDDEDDDYVPAPKKKKRGTKHITASAPERECHRKHCQPANTGEPRMWLLKKKASESASGNRYPTHKVDEFVDDEDSGEDNDEEEDEDDDEEAFDSVNEVVAIKKYRSAGREEYKRHAITNRDDHKFRDTLDRADLHAEKHEYNAALKLFDTVLKANPFSPRAHFGKARVYDIRGEYTTSERDTDLAINEYQEVLDNDDTPEMLFRQAASRLVERARFRGNLHKCLAAQRALIDRFPEEVKLQVDFGLTFVMMKRYEDARKVFADILEVFPNEPQALAYYGYLIKVIDGDIETGVGYMRKGFRLGADEINDAKLYYHLGQGLTMLGRDAEAYSIYEQGVEQGIFLSVHQRSMQNMRLTGRPWWTLEQTGYTKNLKAIERQWVAIRHEALNALHDFAEEWEVEDDSVLVDGRWETFDILSNGRFNKEHCKIIPQTCAMLQDFRDSSNASRSDMQFSVLSSGAQILPHCGPTNSRLQAQLGLIAPSEARIRVGTEQRGWKTGRFIVFDDSFEHAIHFDGASSASFQLVLSIDLWHPEVDPRERISDQ